LEELKHNFLQTVAITDPETLRKVARNTLKRVDAYLQDGGARSQHLLQSSSVSSSQQVKTKKKKKKKKK
jgi:hypothetical protein